jgi:hypothetical protein
LGAAGIMTIRHTGVARGKGHIVRKNQTRYKARRRASRRPFGRHQQKPESKIGIKDPGTRWQLRLKIERTADGFDRKFFGLEFVKRATGMLNELRKIEDWTFWKGRPPPKRLKSDSHT